MVFLGVLGGIYWLHHNKERLGSARDVARDPVCGMQVDTGHPGAVLWGDAQTIFFCSEHCRDRYRAPAALPGS